MALIELLCLRTSDIIAIIHIIVIILLAVVIGYLLQNSYNTNRAIKDYFIHENQDIKGKYNQFLDDLIARKLSAADIQEWFKCMTMRIDVYEEFLTKEFRVKPRLLKPHNKIKHLITGSDEINNLFKLNSIYLTTPTKTQLHKLQREFSISQTKLVVAINKAKINKKHTSKE